MTGADKQRFVIVGLGSIGQRHLRNLRLLRPDARIDVLRRADSAQADLTGCDGVVTSIEDALALRPDGVILAGPAPTHVSLAQAFAGRGVATLIEKPLSHSMVGLTALQKAAQQSLAPVMIGYNLRFNPSLQSVRQAVCSGTIGDVLAVRAEVGQYLPDWRPDADYRSSVSAQLSLGGGALLELSHEIDYIYWMFGVPVRVSCRGGRFSKLDIDVEDCLELTLEYEKPARLVSIHLDFLQRPASRSCKFIGTGGTLTWNALKDQYTLQCVDLPDESRKVVLPMQDRNQMYLDELRAFVDAVEGRSPSSIPLEQGIDVMRIISSARRSLERGRVELVFTEEDS